MDVYGRVARMLLDLAVERDGVLVVETGRSRQEMAARAGASREMIGKILDDLARGLHRGQGRPHHHRPRAARTW